VFGPAAIYTRMHPDPLCLHLPDQYVSIIDLEGGFTGLTGIPVITVPAMVVPLSHLDHLLILSPHSQKSFF